MTAHERLTDEARCDLLCHLVVGQLIEHARSGAWLRAAKSAEAARLWLGADRARTLRAEQAALARTAAALAPAFLPQPAYRDPATLARLAFEIWRMSFTSPLLRTLRAACAARLAHDVPTGSPSSRDTAQRNTPLDGLADGDADPEPNTADAVRYSACIEGQALIVAVGAIRRAQGKRNPQDMPMHAPDWPAVHEAFMRDLLQARNAPLDTDAV